jgi:hypothetical protein
MATELANPAAWYASWAWSLPLIVLNVVIHVVGLGLINERVAQALSHGPMSRSRLMPRFVGAMSVIIVAATALHALEGMIWAGAYRYLGALPDNRLAMLYSISAMTSFGHASLFLEDHWKMMGALEALNGMMLFGLTTAFLFATIQQVWPRGKTDRSGTP